MRRQARIDTPDALHHISREIEQKRIFQDDLDRDVFLSKMVKILPRRPWMIRKVIFREYFEKKSLNMTSVLRLTVSITMAALFFRINFNFMISEFNDGKTQMRNL
jgi:hypothetical protein